MYYTRSYELGSAHRPGQVLLLIWKLIRTIILKKLKLIERIFDVDASDNTEAGWSNAYRKTIAYVGDNFKLKILR